MTWGVNEPSNFGEFWFDGDFIGWKEALKKAYNENISDDEKEQYDFVQNLPKYVFHVAQKFSKITQHEIDHPRAMKPLRSFEAPTRFQFERDRSKRYGSLVKLTARLMVVDHALMTVFEDFEPSVHQFWPIEVLHRDGSTLEKQYFGMRIRQFRDSFLPEQSVAKSFTDEGGTYYVFSFTKEHCKGLAVSSEKIGGAHLWRERKLKRPDMLFSDELMEAISDAGLSIPRANKLYEHAG